MNLDSGPCLGYFLNLDIGHFLIIYCAMLLLSYLDCLLLVCIELPAFATMVSVCKLARIS